jgi:hypothetical protein
LIYPDTVGAFGAAFRGTDSADGKVKALKCPVKAGGGFDYNNELAVLEKFSGSSDSVPNLCE